MRSQSSRTGTTLFLLYLALYGGFVSVAAFAPDWMDARPVGGVNGAIVSGFGLIFVALAMSLVYGWTQRNREGFPATEAAGR